MERRPSFVIPDVHKLGIRCKELLELGKAAVLCSRVYVSGGERDLAGPLGVWGSAWPICTRLGGSARFGRLFAFR